LPTMLEGSQMAPKFNDPIHVNVHILLAVYRIPSKNVDLVLSANIPATRGTDSVDNLDRATFEEIAKSMRILQYGLFA
jgi:hypothetical protein